MHPPYVIVINNVNIDSAITRMLTLFAGEFGQIRYVVTDTGEEYYGTPPPEQIIFTTPTRAIALNVVQVLVAEDVSFEYKAGE